MKRFLRLAALLAQKSDMAKRHGCVLVKKNKIISTGYNTYHQRRNDCWSLHAEANTLKNCNIDPRDSTMYIVRINNIGDYKMSKPCNRCRKIIEKHDIKSIVYSFDDFQAIVEQI